MTQTAPIYVDETHCGGRHVTGLERITLELFSAEALTPLSLSPIRASSRVAMVLAQNFAMPIRAFADRRSILLTPGFPPSVLATLLGPRVIPYIHDLFLITRWADLSLGGRLYMSAPFRLALRMLPRFLVNSQTTANELRRHCRADAEIILYRPQIRDVFELGGVPRGPDAKAPRLVALGTVEPRKNLLAAAAILNELRRGAYPAAVLDIVGRIGWGPDADRLAACPGVTLHGYRTLPEVRSLLAAADALISTSHDEGLGLPLLEAQYGGLAVIAPDKPVFREVLGQSGLFIDPADPASAAASIAAMFANPGWRDAHRAAAADNLARWNGAARLDRATVVALLTALTSTALQV